MVDLSAKETLFTFAQPFGTIYRAEEENFPFNELKIHCAKWKYYVQSIFLWGKEFGLWFLKFYSCVLMYVTWYILKGMYLKPPSSVGYSISFLFMAQNWSNLSDTKTDT